MSKSFENGVLARQAFSQGLAAERPAGRGIPRQRSAIQPAIAPGPSGTSGRTPSFKAPSLRTASKASSHLRSGSAISLPGAPSRRTAPNREIAGYRDVLNTIHTNFADMQLTSNLVLQLHRDLFQFVPGGGGRWKAAEQRHHRNAGRRNEGRPLQAAGPASHAGCDDAAP